MDAIANTNNLYNNYPERSGSPASIDGLIKPVQTQTFLGHSFDCQHRLAGIKKKMNGDMMAGDVGLVAFRYLQCRKGFYKTLFQSIVYTACAIGSVLYSHNPLAVGFAVFTASNAIINGRNAVQYNEATATAGKFLQKRLPPQTLAEIKRLGYNDDGFKKLYKRLEQDGIAVQNLKALLAKRIRVDS